MVSFARRPAQMLFCAIAALAGLGCHWAAGQVPDADLAAPVFEEYWDPKLEADEIQAPVYEPTVVAAEDSDSENRKPDSADSKLGDSGTGMGASADENGNDMPDWLEEVKVGYDGGFVIASSKQLDLDSRESPFRLQINGWGQLRYTYFESEGAAENENQFQLSRGRLVFRGSAFTPDFNYFVQLDGRSSSGDDIRLLDYYLDYDFGRHRFGLPKNRIGFRTGRWKMPFTMARYLSGREFEFTDRSVASTYFDVNRSLGWGLFGFTQLLQRPFDWEVAIYNGLVTGGAETGSSGDLDANFAYSWRIFWYPTGSDWGPGELADFEGHCRFTTRVGAGFANSTINAIGQTEFDSIRVVDSGQQLASLVGPLGVFQYNVDLYQLNFSSKYRGWSFTTEYYMRQLNGFQGAAVPILFDNGLWMQIGKFIVPRKFQLLARWSRVSGDSGTLGACDQSTDERAGGFAWYFREQQAKLVFDFTRLDGAPISSAALNIQPGDVGWLYRTQIQFSF